MSRKMTKRDWGRRRHEIDGIEKSILQQHPPPNGHGRGLDQQRTHIPVVSLVKQNVPPSLFGRCSPVSVTSESSEAETIVSQSYTSRSLSSASSWTDDVYEEETAQKVQQLFDAIDSLLYEGIDLPEECKDLHNECHYWMHTFPHLRINGAKLSIENEQMDDFGNATAVSFTLNQTNDRPKVTYENPKRATSWKSDEALSSLMVQGMSLEPLVMSPIDSNVRGTCNGISTTYEEIIEQQGEYEELIAVDFSDEKQLSHMPDEIQSQSDVEIQLHQQIMERLIKDIWSETISCLRPLLVEYISVVLQGAKYKNYDAHATNKLPDNYTLAESSPVRLPTAQLTNQGFADLQGLLTISSKTLLSRSFDKNSRSTTQTSAPPAMVGARLSSSHRGVNKSSRGRLAPLERSVRTSIPTSSMGLVTQDNWKTPISLAPPPVSPHSWGRHFPLPPIESGLQSAYSPMVASVQKLKPTCSAVIRMLSGSSNKRGVTRDSSKIRANAGNYSNFPVSKANISTKRLFSAQVDTIRSYPASYAAVGERVKSSSKFTDFRVQQEIINKGRGSENDKKERLPSGYSYNNFERRNNNR